MIKNIGCLVELRNDALQIGVIVSAVVTKHAGENICREQVPDTRRDVEKYKKLNLGGITT